MADLILRGRVDELQRRIERLEQAVALLSEAAGVNVPAGDPPFDPEVVALLRDGKRIKAVKMAAERFGISLQEATEYVGRAEGSPDAL